MSGRRGGTLAGAHCRHGLQEPGRMREPLFGPAPFVAIIFGAEIDAAAVAMIFAAGDAVGDAAALGAMSIIGMHIRNVVPAELIEKTHRIRVTAQDPGVLAGGEAGEGFGGQ